MTVEVVMVAFSVNSAVNLPLSYKQNLYYQAFILHDTLTSLLEINMHQ